jgi:glycosyltransferase involved in cell wall biosynthesis
MADISRPSASARAPISVNARFHVHHKTGMQRYAYEIASRLEGKVREIRPRRALKGPAGHLWEQCYLPSLAAGSLLWSPNNTGPVITRHQVCTIHDIIPIDHPEWFSKSFAAWYKWLLPALARSAQHLIAVSEFTRSRVIDAFGLKPEKVSVVLNGIGSEFTPRTNEEIERVKSHLELPAKPYVLYVGSLEPRKNLPRLLTAWTLVQRKCQDMQLVIAGLNKGGSKVFSAVPIDKIPSGVFFTGFVEDADLPALYSGATIFVYPSLYEGFGLPPAEAMACGTPVITSKGTSLSEVVGSAALLVDPKSAESIADAILRVAASESLSAEMRRTGLARARQFNWDDAATQTWSILSREAAQS